LATGFARLGQYLRQQSWAQGGQDGLTATQAQIVCFLAGPSDASHTLGAVAAALAVQAPTASEAVTSLERKGLVEKRPLATDRRTLSIALTARGQQVAQRQRQWPDLFLGALGALDEVEQAALQRALVKVIHALQLRGEIPISKLCVTCRHFRPHAYPHDPRRPHHCGYVDAPFGEADLRLDCADHRPVAPELRDALYATFARAPD
jgi:DNA-binding MarR family transcriptional regulator